MNEHDDQILSRRKFFATGTVAASTLLLTTGPAIARQPITLTFLPTYLRDGGATAAAVIAVIQMAIKLNDLFNKDTGNTEKLLTEIRDQNAQIIALLENVLIILSNMGVVIRAGVRDELVNDTKVTLKVALERFYAVWAAELRNPKTKEEAETKYRIHYETIANLGRKIATAESYGYAHFNTVGNAMFAENWISNRLRESRDFRRTGFRAYADYFEGVVNPSESGSVAFQLAAAKAQIARMDKILTAAEKYQPKSLVVGHQVVSHRGLNTTYADITKSITGNRNTGYRYTELQSNFQTETEPKDKPPPGGRGLLSALSVFSPTRDPVDSGDQSLAGRVNYWNSARSVMLVAQSEADALEKSMEAAAIYRDVAVAIART